MGGSAARCEGFEPGSSAFRPMGYLQRRGPLVPLRRRAAPDPARKQILFLGLLLVLAARLPSPVSANPDAKRLYDDLLSNYNRLIRPVSNNTDTVLVKLGLRLSQLIDLVCRDFPLTFDFSTDCAWVV
ncbi:hypothetical protein J437_LFUL000851 [Ladona fulva]|uniref:Neurotransmitter-gated ion-channel ligand-binding domain-containing protein n=1 Tax=Ladona fulva TaxID=123851 RepID=A0A8K0JUD1_LADFU|nr:hypothetical protein J437_LFUL000851 [Ladona fulva]